LNSHIHHAAHLQRESRELLLLESTYSTLQTWFPKERETLLEERRFLADAGPCRESAITEEGAVRVRRVYEGRRATVENRRKGEVKVRMYDT